MTRDEIAALVQARWSAWNRHDIATDAEMFAADCVIESPTAGGVVHGRTSARDINRAWLAGFPDVKFVIADLVIDGDRAFRGAASAYFVRTASRIPSSS